MIINNKEIDFYKKFKVFKKKLKNYLNTAPVLVDITYYDDKSLKIKSIFNDYSKKFELDLSLDVKSLIFIIKSDLESNLYPVISGVKTIKEDYTESELSSLLNNNPKLNLEKVLMTKKITKIKYDFRIEKVFNKTNRILIKNIKNKNVFLYKLEISSFLFLKKLLSKNLDAYQGFNLFKTKSKFIKKIN